MNKEQENEIIEIKLTRNELIAVLTAGELTYKYMTRDPKALEMDKQVAKTLGFSALDAMASGVEKIKETLKI